MHFFQILKFLIRGGKRKKKSTGTFFAYSEQMKYAQLIHIQSIKIQLCSKFPEIFYWFPESQTFTGPLKQVNHHWKWDSRDILKLSDSSQMNWEMSAKRLL